ncbi:unnamed protein product [Echinostoma caproni]|uniref:BRCT domain-containing protein n=1 Tax=Echinostoma caproni TaxID=27848 RepID=A0A183AQB5_9TREM|nr:unnamed protein product [Echinostoma caproni]
MNVFILTIRYILGYGRESDRNQALEAHSVESEEFEGKPVGAVRLHANWWMPHASIRSSFNRLTDLPDESTGENADEDSEYSGTRIFGILPDGLGRLSDSSGGTVTKSKTTDRALPKNLGPELTGDDAEHGAGGALTDGSVTTSGGDETHTSEDASIDTIKPAHPSREPSPTSSTTSASEGSEDIEPFPSPPPEAALIDSYQGRSSPLTHSHLVLSAGLDEVIEEETGASEMEADAVAAAMAIAVLDAATNEGNDGEPEEGEDDEEEEEDEETSNATVIVRESRQSPPPGPVPGVSGESEETSRPISLPEPTEQSEECSDEKTPTGNGTPIEELIAQVDTPTGEEQLKVTDEKEDLSKQSEQDLSETLVDEAITKAGEETDGEAACQSVETQADSVADQQICEESMKQSVPQDESNADEASVGESVQTEETAQIEQPLEKQEQDSQAMPETQEAAVETSVEQAAPDEEQQEQQPSDEVHGSEATPSHESTDSNHQTENSSDPNASISAESDEIVRDDAAVPGEPTISESPSVEQNTDATEAS